MNLEKFRFLVLKIVYWKSEIYSFYLATYFFYVSNYSLTVFK